MDNTLHTRALQGEENAFREIVDTHQVMVRSITRKFALNQEDAEDIAQIVFLDVFKNLHTFRGSAKLSTWIYRITLTKCIDFTRKQKRRSKILQIKDFFSLTGHEKEYRDMAQSPDKQYVANEQKSILYSALEKLPDSQRSALLLSKIEGLGQQEIADTLGTTIPAVESLLHRAKTTLRKTLQRNEFKD